MRLIDHLIERIHRPHDELARAQGLTVERLPGGRRRVGDPRLPDILERRRRRLIREGLDPIDRALMDEPTARLFAETARRMRAEAATRRERRAASEASRRAIGVAP
jgi:hypothetical protein